MSDSTNSTHKGVSSFVRWLLFLPGAGVAASVSWFAFAFLSQVTMGRVEADGDGLFTSMAGGALIGAVFVWVGTWIAPPGKASVPWVLAVLCAVFFGVMLVPGWQSARYTELASTLAMVIGAFAVARSLATSPGRTQAAKDS